MQIKNQIQSDMDKDETIEFIQKYKDCRYYYTTTSSYESTQASTDDVIAEILIAKNILSYINYRMTSSGVLFLELAIHLYAVDVVEDFFESSRDFYICIDVGKKKIVDRKNKIQTICK